MHPHAFARLNPGRPQRVGELVGERLELRVRQRFARRIDGEMVRRPGGERRNEALDAHHESPIIRATMSRCISDVPEKMRDGIASRRSASIPVSVAAPEAPKI